MCVHLWHCILPTQSEKLARRDISSCGSTETRRGTLTALKSLAGPRRSQQRTARRRAAAAAAGSPQATLAFQNSPGRGLRCRAAAAAAARGLPTHSGARRAGGRAPTTRDAGAEIIRGPSGRALTAPRRARAAAAAARGRHTHTPPRGGRARERGRRNNSRPPALICCRRRSDRKDDPTKERGDAPRALRDGGRTGRQPCSELPPHDVADPRADRAADARAVLPAHDAAYSLAHGEAHSYAYLSPDG